MTLDRTILEQRRLVLLLAAAIALAGIISWFVMPRQEDPSFPNRNGLIVAPLPGADAARVERLVVEPIEDALTDIDEIDHVESSARAGVGVIRLFLRDEIDVADPVWDDVQNRLDDVRSALPEAALVPTLTSNLTELQSVILAVSGSDDRLRLSSAAEHIETRLLGLPATSRVEITPDVGEQITVAIDDASTRRFGLSRGALARQIEARTQVVPGGTVTDGQLSVVVDPRSDFSSVDTLRAMPIRLRSGSTLPLSQLADVRRTPEYPTSALLRFDGRTAVAVGVVPKPGVDVVAFGAQVERLVEEVRAEVAPLSVDWVTNQPRRVEARLADLGGSLLLSAVVVGGVLFLFMGPRLGTVVASIVPLVTFSSLAIYAFFGGVLQQISIAAMVLSLGLLVDNAIVIAERVQARLDEGDRPWQAAGGTIRELSWPLLTATGTTLASFVPLLLSDGPTGDFTRAIPQLVMLTLTVSFVFAITVTPTLASLVFRPSRRARTERASARLAAFAAVPTRRPGAVVVGGLALVAAASALLPFVQQQFFPAGDRNQAVLTLQLEEGTHLQATSDAAATIERALWTRPEVVSVASFVGQSTPRFYYNLPQRPAVPHVAQLLVTTERTDQVVPLLAWARDAAAELLPGDQLVARKLEQGPPLDAPLEFRLLGPDGRALWDAANAAHQALRSTPGTIDVRHDLGRGTPTITLGIVDEAAARRGISPAAVASSVLGQTRGLEAGSVWTADTPVPIVVRSPEGERFPLDALGTVDVWSPSGPLPLANHAATEVDFRPSVIHRRDRQRVVTVSAQLVPGVAFSEALRATLPRIETIADRAGLELQIGGEAEGSGTANTAILVAAPIGAVLLLVSLLAQFRSFRRVGMVLATVPLAATGVIPGLLLMGQPFGFTSLLGVFALVGIVVNNAIILIDWIDQRRAEGDSVDEAVQSGVMHRTRPILLTTGTTIVGLLPLLFSSSTLWPPLASALVSGLAASTGLTLLVVPALYMAIFGPRRWSVGPGMAAALLAMGLALPADAAEITLSQAMELAAERPTVKAADARVRAAQAATRGAVGRAFLPVLSSEVTATRRESELALDVPDAPIEIVQTPRDTIEGAAVVRVPLLDVGAMASWRAAASARDAHRAGRSATERDARLDAAVRCIDQWDLDAGIASLEALVVALEQEETRVRSTLAEGRGMRSDLLQVQVSLADAEQQRLQLTQTRRVAAAALGAAVGSQALVDCLRPLDLAAWTTPTTAAQVRPELRQVDAEATALRRQRAALRGALVPRISLEGRFTATNNEALLPNRWTQGSLIASWTPVAGGSRWAADRELTAELRSTEHRREEVGNQLEVATRAAAAELEVATAAIPIRALAVEHAREAARLVAAQAREGRATVVDLLRAQASLAEQRTRLARAEHGRVRAALRLAHARGAAVDFVPIPVSD